MEITLIGLVVAAAGLLLLLRASATAMLCFLMVCSLFGGAAAINLPALGGASIPPAYFAVVFLCLRVMMGSIMRPGLVAWSLTANIFLAVFVLYGAVGAFALPRMFQGQIELAPMRVSGTGAFAPFATDPLQPSAQNITQAFYLVGTFLAACAATIIARREQRPDAVVKTGLALGVLHIGFGLLDLGFSYAGRPDALDWLRNGNYAQLSQTAAGGFHRISGVFPEPSTFAIYGFMLLVFSTELWLRSVRPMLSGLVALGLAVVLALSTSSTAYVSMGVYALLLVLRLTLLMPTGRSLMKAFQVVSVLMFGAVLFLGLRLWRPDLAASLVNLVLDMTAQKSATLSAVQRGFWARQGVEAFWASSGLGVGPGSFRSSSLAAAILGSMGAVGAVSFLLHLLRVLGPFRRSTYDLGAPPMQALASAVGWTAVAGLIPAFVAAAGPDPGLLFAIFGGLGLAWAEKRVVVPAEMNLDQAPAFGEGRAAPAALHELGRGRGLPGRAV